MTTAGPHMEGDIVDYLRKATPRGFFRGVLCGDDRPRRVPDGGYLVNVDRRAGPGTHWTALAVRSPYAYYVDSVGLPPPAILSGALRALRLTIISSNSQQQRLNEPRDESCGRRAALALTRLSAAKTSAELARIFETIASL